MPACPSNSSSAVLCWLGNITTTVAPLPLTTERHRLNEVAGWDDATWVLSSAFIIFTMQSGFGLLESGMVSRKNEVSVVVVTRLVVFISFHFIFIFLSFKSVALDHFAFFIIFTVIMANFSFVCITHITKGLRGRASEVRSAFSFTSKLQFIHIC